MIKTTNTLTCKFMDNLGKNHGINIDNPKENLTVEEIEAFMYYVIDSSVVMPDANDSDAQLIMIAGASIISKVVESIEV